MDNQSNIQLLANVIGRKNNDVAEQLLHLCNDDLTQLENYLDLADIKGLGNSSKQAIKFAIQLGRRIEEAKMIKNLNAEIVNSSRTIYGQFQAYMGTLDHEELWAIYMSKNGRILDKKQIGIGSCDACVADIKTIAYHAVALKASYIALVHNHPHSTTRPSRPDRDLTSHVKSALELFDVKLLDHVIIADDRYYSFADNAEL